MAVRRTGGVQESGADWLPRSLHLPSFGLLVSLAALILLEPVAERFRAGVPALAVLHLAVLGLAVRMVSRARGEVRITWLLAAPTIALTLLGGVIADRADRRRIMILSQAASALMFFTLATLVMLNLIALWHVIAAAVMSGCVRAFDRPSRMALLPQMVPKDDIANAVAIGGTIWQLNRLVGPALAGMLIYLIGIGPTYYFCFGASLLAVFLWLGIRLIAPSRAPSPRW